MAPTRQYASSGAPGISGAPPNYYEGSETARFQRDLRQASPPLYTVPQPKGSSGAFWALVAVVAGLATAGILSVALLSMSVNGTRIATRIGGTSQLEDEIRRGVERELKQAEASARAGAQGQREAFRAMEEAARLKERAVAQGLSAPLPLDELIYPEAEVVTRIARGPAAQIATLRTHDDMESVKEFYVGKLGPAQSASKTGLGFKRSLGGVRFIVKVAPRAGVKNQLEIAIVRTVSGRDDGK
ncbi:MAG: hypothetical protein ABI882_21335 [Acidobacteriota bacterium]